MTEATTIDAAELARFEALGETWWDPKGPMAPLHAINPVRLGFLRDVMVRHFSRDARGLRPLSGLRILDIGCGGGLLSEPLTRMGATVTGIDPPPAMWTWRACMHRPPACPSTIGRCLRRISSRQARRSMWCWALGSGGACGGRRPVRAPGRALVAPNGLFLGSTLNRTAKSFALAIVGAEYVLRWLPRGTHSWDKFVTRTSSRPCWSRRDWRSPSARACPSMRWRGAGRCRAISTSITSWRRFHAERRMLTP